MLFLILLLTASVIGCGGNTYQRLMRSEEHRRQAIEQIVPEVFRDPLPFRIDRYEAIGVSDEMMLEEVSRHRAMQDAIVKLSLATRLGILADMKDYLASHPVYTQIAKIDTTLSLSENFYERASEVITRTYMEGFVASQFWRDEHGLIGRKGMMYAYAFVPKYPELMKLEALRLTQEEMEKVRQLMLRRSLAESTRKRMDELLDKMKGEIQERETASQESPDTMPQTRW